MNLLVTQHTAEPVFVPLDRYLSAGHGRICPLCERPTLTVKQDRVYCFGCGAHG